MITEKVIPAMITEKVTATAVVIKDRVCKGKISERNAGHITEGPLRWNPV